MYFFCIPSNILHNVILCDIKAKPIFIDFEFRKRQLDFLKLYFLPLYFHLSDSIPMAWLFLKCFPLLPSDPFQGDVHLAAGITLKLVINLFQGINLIFKTSRKVFSQNKNSNSGIEQVSFMCLQSLSLTFVRRQWDSVRK